MLFKRGKTYYCRVWIPLDLRHVFNCHEIKRSLKTSNRIQARIAVASFESEAERLFFLLRSNMLEHDSLITIEDFGEQLKHSLVESLTNQRRKNSPAVYLPVPLRDKLPDNLPRQALLDLITSYHSHVKREANQNIHFNDHDSIKFIVDEVIKVAVPDDLKPTEEQYDSLCEVIHKALHHLSKDTVEQMRGNYSTPPVKLAPAIAAPVPVTSSKRLSDLWRSYLSEKTDNPGLKTSIKPITASRYKAFFNTVIDILGDVYIDDPVKETTRTMLKSLECYPNNKDKYKYFAGKSFDREWVNHPDWKPLSEGTINNIMIFMSSLYKFAMKDQKTWGVTQNPFSDVQLKARPDSKPKERYNEIDIANLYKGLSIVNKTYKPELFWIPLIALYSGMRLDEICQLRPNDINMIDGVFFIKIIDNEELQQKTKNKNSRRSCPVHPTLQALGFLDYVRQQQNKKSVMLFEAMTFKDGKWSKDFGKRYGTFARKYVTKEKTKTFHSMRHTFPNWFKQTGLPTRHEERILKSMIGHYAGCIEEDITFSINENGYCEDYPPSTQYELLCKLDYGVSFDILLTG